MDTLHLLLNDFGLSSPLTNAQKWELINRIARGEIRDVTEIARILAGN